MKRIALALIACAGCGLLARSQKPATCENVAVVPVTQNLKKTEAPAPAPTPLVAKLLPGGGVKEAPSKAAPPALRDGQLSPGGNFRYSAARNIYVPIDFGHTRYTENGHAPTAEHLIREHGHARSSAEKWTQREREIAHANDHAILGAVRQVAPPRYTSSCPNGQCGNPSYGRGLFGRRR